MLDSGPAFLEIPAAPLGAGALAATPDPTARQAQLPGGLGRLGLSYDWAAQRWLPVPARFVAPDGASYAYTDSQARIHVLTIKDGTDRMIAPSGRWGLYGFTLKGVYAGQEDPTQNSPAGLYVLAPDGSSSVQLAAAGTWLLVGKDAAWSLAATEPAPAGANVLGSVVGTKLARLDLATGQQNAWYLATDGRVGLAALDAGGHPVLVNVDLGQVVVVRAPNTADSIFDRGLPLTVMADSDGVWIGHPMTIAIYLSLAGSDASRWGQYAYNGAIQFAGACG